MKKRKILYGRIILVLLILLFICFAIFLLVRENGEQPEQEEQEGQQEPVVETIPALSKTDFSNDIINSKVSDEVETKIVNFINEYYSIMAKLETKDVTTSFYEVNESALIYQTVIDLLVELRSMKHVDLTLYDATYDLEITDVTMEDNIMEVTVLEDSYLNFSFMKDIKTEVLNVSNTFTFANINGSYELIKYKKAQDFYVLVTDKYDGGGIDELRSIKVDYISQTVGKVAELKNDYNEFLETGITSDKDCLYEYDRDAADLYSHEWIGSRNDEWMTFGSNCQNYASQVLIAGGIPMDPVGNANKQLQWKFYDSSYNLKEEEKGYNYTWTYVPYFYSYAKDNTGPGLCATVDENIYFAEAGDVIQLGTIWYDRHTVVVTKPYKKDGVVQDVLLNSNSVDLKNFPLSAYTYPYARLIKVHGYN